MILENKMLEIIERKYKELSLGKGDQIFSKIRAFEANAIGQIGEEFIKYVVSQITPIEQGDNIHNEYDILTKSGIYFEIKTARKGRTSNTFQFNGINPRYNYHYLICLGLCEDKILYRLFEKQDIAYIHKERKYFIRQNELKKQLVPMNPDNQVNYKLTLNIKELYSIEKLSSELKNNLNP